MPKCRDCVHSEICANHLKAVRGIYGAVMSISGREVNRLETALSEISITIEQIGCDDCDHFHDSSRFVELPCKVGDSYFEIEQYCTERGFYNEPRQTDIMDCEFCDVDGVCDRQYYITEKRFISLIQIFSYKEKVVDRYNRIFLTKEEAEQALKLKIGDTNA